MKAVVARQGRTITITVTPDHVVGLVGVGVASCARDDHFVPEIGEGIALGRALKSLGEQIEARWEVRVVTKDEVAARRRAKEWARAARALDRPVEPEPEKFVV